jgi:ABC-2 type transport system ATP-binding protein
MSGRADRGAARQAMTTLGLDPDEKKPVGKYSLGQRQRMGFAQAFMENPDVLILDEPFNAMDKASMEEVHDLLQKFKTEGKTVILASHSATDIKKACDVVYEMENGDLHLTKN